MPPRRSSRNVRPAQRAVPQHRSTSDPDSFLGAIASVLLNAERHAGSLRATCGGEEHAAGRGAGQGPSAPAGAGAARVPGYAPPPTAGKATGVRKGRRVAYPWRPQQVEVLTEYLRSLPAGQKASTGQALDLLGWSGAPHPDRALCKKAVWDKMGYLRRLLRHGEDPMEGKGARGNRCWRVWLRRAFAQLPGHKGTASDLAAVIGNDPEVAPALDRRPMVGRKDRYPKWKHQLTMALSGNRYPEIVRAGDRQGRLTVYSFDEQKAALMDPSMGWRSSEEH